MTTKVDTGGLTSWEAVFETFYVQNNWAGAIKHHERTVMALERIAHVGEGATAQLAREVLGLSAPTNVSVGLFGEGWSAPSGERDREES